MTVFYFALLPDAAYFNMNYTTELGCKKDKILLKDKNNLKGLFAQYIGRFYAAPDVNNPYSTLRNKAQTMFIRYPVQKLQQAAQIIKNSAIMQGVKNEKT